ncbi:MAG TPA: hypothetical protein DGT23_10365, partial [Micromonosporaceae bacterium]|nr:hypothetical protein [Micromonosporaceae bacterium]
MIDQELTGLFATLDREPEPPLPPGQLEQIVTLGRRKARNHRFAKAAALIVMTLTLGLAGYVLPGQLPTGLGGGDDGVVL